MFLISFINKKKKKYRKLIKKIYKEHKKEIMIEKGTTIFKPQMHFFCTEKQTVANRRYVANN